jgi:hypothetical protein
MASYRRPLVTTINPEVSHELRALADVAAASVIVGAGAGLPPEARHDWERGVAHPQNFVSTARQTRIDDVRPASKWSGISFYENSPKEIKRHMDIMGIVDNNHIQVLGTSKCEHAPHLSRDSLMADFKYLIFVFTSA